MRSEGSDNARVGWVGWKAFALIWIVALALTGAACSDDEGSTTNASNGGVADVAVDTSPGTTMSPDTGLPDTETPSEDTETPPEDTETPPEDTETPPEDTETPPEDTDTPPEDTSTGMDTAVDTDIEPDVPVPTGPPVILALSPEEGPVGGGTELLVTGVNFTETTRIFVGPLAATNVELLSNTQILCDTPPGAVGAVTVKAQDIDGEGVLEDSFTYFEPLRVNSVSPNRSPVRGGELVELRGAGFKIGRAHV